MSTKTKTSARLTEADLSAKYSTIVAGSLRFDEARNKQVVVIKTVDVNGVLDGNTREIATSDLHQCRWTEATKKDLDRAKARAKSEARRAAKAAQPKVAVASTVGV
jgi:hypothetical protein